MREWLYYNFSAGSFHAKKLRSGNRLYSIEIEFSLKKQSIVISATLCRLKGSVRILSIARWKARG